MPHGNLCPPLLDGPKAPLKRPPGFIPGCHICVTAALCLPLSCSQRTAVGWYLSKEPRCREILCGAVPLGDTSTRDPGHWGRMHLYLQDPVASTVHPRDDIQSEARTERRDRVKGGGGGAAAAKILTRQSLCQCTRNKSALHTNSKKSRTNYDSTFAQNLSSKVRPPRNLSFSGSPCAPLRNHRRQNAVPEQRRSDCALSHWCVVRFRCCCRKCFAQINHSFLG